MANKLSSLSRNLQSTCRFSHQFPIRLAELWIYSGHKSDGKFIGQNKNLNSSQVWSQSPHNFLTILVLLLSLQRKCLSTRLARSRRVGAGGSRPSRRKTTSVGNGPTNLSSRTRRDPRWITPSKTRQVSVGESMAVVMISIRENASTWGVEGEVNQCPFLM